jgi:hypothetical protein
MSLDGFIYKILVKSKNNTKERKNRFNINGYKARKFDDDSYSDKHTRDYFIEVQQREDEAEKILYGKLRKAKSRDYKKWLKGHLENGGEITHKYPYSFSRLSDQYYVAKSNFRISPLYGAGSIYIIVPKNVNFLGGEVGHNTLFFKKDYTRKGGSVNSFSDIKLGDKHANR